MATSMAILIAGLDTCDRFPMANLLISDDDVVQGIVLAYLFYNPSGVLVLLQAVPRSTGRILTHYGWKTVSSSVFHLFKRVLNRLKVLGLVINGTATGTSPFNIPPGDASGPVHEAGGLLQPGPHLFLVTVQQFLAPVFNGLQLAVFAGSIDASFPEVFVSDPVAPNTIS